MAVTTHDTRGRGNGAAAKPAVPFEPIVGAHLEHVMEKQSTQWLFAPFDAAAVWATNWVDYWTRAMKRRATPLDVASDVVRFWSTVTARPNPKWVTEHRVAAQWPVARLLDFSDGTGGIPTLLLPPQAGHASTIVDYSPQQSQVRFALRSLEQVYVLEWLGATEETKNTRIEDYIAIMDEAVAALGGRVNLVGDCQGGWLATIYAALRPQAVTTLTIGAAPIDFQAGNASIHDWVERFGMMPDPMAVYKALVKGGHGVHRGENQITGFKMMEPAGEAERFADLWGNIGNESYVERYLDFVAWFETPQAMPGAFYLWTVEHLFVNNELIQGTLEVGGEKVDLGRITVPLYLLAGTRDHITPPEQVWALAEYAGTPREHVHGRFFEAGHLGLFMGSRPLVEHWAPIFADIAGENERLLNREAQARAAETEARTAPVVTEAAPVTKAAPAKKSTPVKKVTAKKAAPAKTAAPVQAAPPAKTTPPKTAPEAGEGGADTLTP